MDTHGIFIRLLYSVGELKTYWKENPNQSPQGMCLLDDLMAVDYMRR